MIFASAFLLRVFPVFLGLVAATSSLLAQTTIPKITGVREWVFADGSKERARIRVWEGKVWVGGDGRQSWKKEIDRSIPGQKEILEGIEAGRIHMVAPKIQYSVKTPSGDIDPSNYERPELQVGKEREWMRTDGKSAKGALFNLADDEIAIIIGDQVWKIPVVSLGLEDRAYLDRVARDEEQLYPFSVSCPRIIYANNEFEEAPLRISGERFLDAPAVPISFEEVYKRVDERLSAKVDRKSWELFKMTEHTFTLRPEASEKVKGWNPATFRRGYQVCFQINESKVGLVKEKLGNRVSPNGWYWEYVLDDGTFLDIRLLPKK